MERIILGRRGVRAGLVLLALPQLAIGVWAIASPSGWFDTFPGAGAQLAAALRPVRRAPGHRRGVDLPRARRPPRPRRDLDGPPPRAGGDDRLPRLPGAAHDLPLRRRRRPLERRPDRERHRLVLTIFLAIGIIVRDGCPDQRCLAPKCQARRCLHRKARPAARRPRRPLRALLRAARVRTGAGADRCLPPHQGPAVRLRRVRDGDAARGSRRGAAQAARRDARRAGRRLRVVHGLRLDARPRRGGPGPPDLRARPLPRERGLRRRASAW